MPTEKLLLNVTVPADVADQYRAGTMAAVTVVGLSVSIHEVPLRPANEVLAEALGAACFLSHWWEQRSSGTYDADAKAQKARDLAAQVRALASGPQAEDWETAAREYIAAIPLDSDEHAIAMAAIMTVRARAAELAAERGAK
jgi:hypothetical protein